MKPIQIKNDNGEYIGLVVTPETGDNISSENVNKIFNIIKSNIDKSFSKYLENITISEGLIKFNMDENELLFKVIDFCRNNLSEKIIVPQNMGSGPFIRHRPLYFGINKEKNGIELKYTELGSFNSIDVAINNLI